ncbi:MAG: periplasmic heavy metal sensor [Halieaceae bacterium]|jgi:uncharacterized membrane protein
MSHRALTGLLIASMAVNLLLAGLIIGHMVRSDGARELPLAWAFKEVAPEIREKVRPIIQPQAGEILSERRALRRQERKLRRLLESETLTREELETALYDMRLTTNQFHEKLHEIGVDALMSLNAAERAAAAPYLFRPPQQGRKGHHRPREDRGEKQSDR